MKREREREREREGARRERERRVTEGERVHKIEQVHVYVVFSVPPLHSTLTLSLSPDNERTRCTHTYRVLLIRYMYMIK